MTHPFKRTALILACGGALCAYATAASAQFRPNFPTRLEPPPAQAAPPAEETPNSAASQATPAPRSAPVDSRPLSALPPAARRVQAPEPAEAPATRPAFRTETRRTVTGRVVEVEGRARTYEVKKGDTLEKVADRLDTTVAQLKKDNRLKGSTIRPGDELKGPKTSAKAYVVGSGDTLSSVSRRFGVSTEALREENDLGRNAALRSGQRLRLPSGFRDKGPITVTSRVATEEAEPAPAPSRTSRRQAEQPPNAESEDEVPVGRGTRRTVTGRVTEVEGPPRTHTVRKGDTLEEIADKLDTTVSALKKDNKLKSSTIRPGQTLKGPRSTAKAYVAVSGDTLAAIARRFGVTPEALRRANGLNRNAAIRAGQTLRLPSGYRDRGPITETFSAPARPLRRPEPPAAAPVEEATPPVRSEPPPRREETPPPLPSRPQPYVPSGRPAPPVQAPPRAYTPPATTPTTPRAYTPQATTPGGGPVAAPVAAPPPTDAAISSMGRGRFIWPARGDVISDFGPKTVGQRNDGVNIRANTGEPVRAAAAGEVVYAGDQVPGFGNLVLIKHNDGWVTAYGHLSRVEVKMKQAITQGQQIGQVGSSGGVSEPQLHFEVRYAPSTLERAKPIDPSLVLPR